MDRFGVLASEAALGACLGIHVHGIRLAPGVPPMLARLICWLFSHRMKRMRLRGRDGFVVVGAVLCTRCWRGHIFKPPGVSDRQLDEALHATKRRLG